VLALSAVQVAVPFVWLGAVLAISFLETPLKFRAPGITLALGLGIGRLVFRALNIAELVLAGLLTAAMLASLSYRGSSLATAILIALWALLICQVAVVRPQLSRRTRQIIAGEDAPRSRMHLIFVALELAKVGLLPILGVLLLVRTAA
jgi:hypothetical protein